ncbi:MAG TPA: hypothetical protein VII30_02950 [Gemmatimonadaceae bacterium]|jgi:hypothetical protein
MSATPIRMEAVVGALAGCHQGVILWVFLLCIQFFSANELWNHSYWLTLGLVVRASDPDGNLFRVFYDFATPEREPARATAP